MSQASIRIPVGAIVAVAIAIAGLRSTGSAQEASATRAVTGEATASEVLAEMVARKDRQVPGVERLRSLPPDDVVRAVDAALQEGWLTLDSDCITSVYMILAEVAQEAGPRCFELLLLGLGREPLYRSSLLGLGHVPASLAPVAVRQVSEQLAIHWKAYLNPELAEGPTRIDTLTGIHIDLLDVRVREALRTLILIGRADATATGISSEVLVRGDCPGPTRQVAFNYLVRTASGPGEIRKLHDSQDTPGRQLALQAIVFRLNRDARLSSRGDLSPQVRAELQEIVLEDLLHEQPEVSDTAYQHLGFAFGPDLIVELGSGAQGINPKLDRALQLYIAGLGQDPERGARAVALYDKLQSKVAGTGDTGH